MMEMKKLSILAMLIGLASLLMCSCIPQPIGATTSQGSEPASADAVTSHTVNVTGLVVDAEGYRILSDFIAVAVNNATGKRVLSDPFNNGNFLITLYVPGFADDNQTIFIQIMSVDQKTVYGSALLFLADLNSTSSYSLVVAVANPPPNYNWLILIAAVLIFSMIIAGYILFTKWLIGQAVLRRTDEILIKNRMGEENLDENATDEADDADEDNTSGEDEKVDG